MSRIANPSAFIPASRSLPALPIHRRPSFRCDPRRHRAALIALRALYCQSICARSLSFPRISSVGARVLAFYQRFPRPSSFSHQHVYHNCHPVFRHHTRRAESSPCPLLQRRHRCPARDVDCDSRCHNYLRTNRIRRRHTDRHWQTLVDEIWSRLPVFL